MAARTPGTKAPYPSFIEPALATSIDKVPSGERWLYEIKSTVIACSSISLTTRSRSTRGAKIFGDVRGIDAHDFAT
jgi:hypothetical protein